MSVTLDERLTAETPIAVMRDYCHPRRPDGEGFDWAIFADGSAYHRENGRINRDLTAEEIRQLHAEMEFGRNDMEYYDWLRALHAQRKGAAEARP